MDRVTPYHVGFGRRATRSGHKLLKLCAFQQCSCYVLLSLIGCRHGSIDFRPETPAGKGAALRAGGRLCRRGDRIARRRGRTRAPARARRPKQCRGSLRAAGAHRLRRRLAFARRIAAVQDHGGDRRHPQDHHPQRLARHRFRPFDQSLSRLRAWLRLLLRAPDPRLSRPVAGAGFRIEAVREAGSRRTFGERIVGARLFAEGDRHRHQYRSLSADRAALQSHAPHPGSARPRQPSGRHCHQVGAGAARSRHPRPHGRTQARESGAIGDHARRRTRAQDGAARGDADAAAGDAAPAGAGRRADDGDGGAGDPGAQRHGNRTHPGGGGDRRRQGGGLRAAAPAARSARPVPRMAAGKLPTS